MREKGKGMAEKKKNQKDRKNHQQHKNIKSKVTSTSQYSLNLPFYLHATILVIYPSRPQFPCVQNEDNTTIKTSIKNKRV